MTATLLARDLAVAGRLRPVDLELHSGKLIALVGPNGSGKTSLLHALAGIAAATGLVRLNGADPRRAPVSQRRHLMSFLPATREVHWPLSARDLVKLGGGDDRQADEALERLGLSAAADRRVDRLSTGERNRVLLARALAPVPMMLLLDEPAANLDPLWQLEVMALLRRDAMEKGQLVLVAMHDLDLAEHYADRLLLMSDGAMVADGDPVEILEGPLVADVFGIERRYGIWQPVNRRADPQSLP